MKTLARAVAVLFLVGLMPMAADAVCTVCGPANSLRWTAPTTNTDATPLTDFAGFEVIVAVGTAGACVSTSSVIRDVGALGVPPTPLVNTQVGVTLGSLTLTQGQKVAAVRAYDTAGNRSACSAEVNFTFDAAAPSAPTGLGTQ